MLHAPKQTRSKKTLERILSSARMLMATEGVDGVGITQIVAEAKSSVGSFYARFDGKEDLVRHLHDRLWEEAGSRWEEGIAHWDRTARIEDRVGALVEIIRDAVAPDQALRGALTQVMGDEGEAAQRAFENLVIRDGLNLLARDDGIRHPAPSTGVTLGIRMALSTLRDHLDKAPGTSPANGSGDLTNELKAALRGYWGVGRRIQVGGPDSDSAIEYFDIWN